MLALSDITKDGQTAFAAGGSGSFSITQTEVDFGTTGKVQKSFVITNASVTALSKIMAQVAYVAPTSKQSDEVEMDQLDILCAPAAGSFTMLVISRTGPVHGNFKINYTIG